MDREKVIDAYRSAWDEEDPVRREAIVKAVWEEGATYTLHRRGRMVLTQYPDSRTPARALHCDAWNRGYCGQGFEASIAGSRTALDRFLSAPISSATIQST